MPCSGHVFLSVCSEMHAGNGLAPTEGDLSLGTKALEEVKCKCTRVWRTTKIRFCGTWQSHECLGRWEDHGRSERLIFYPIYLLLPLLPLVSTCAMRGTAPSKASETSGTKD